MEREAVVLYEVGTVLVLQEKEGDWFLKLADEQSSAMGLRNTMVREEIRFVAIGLGVAGGRMEIGLMER